MNEDSFGETEQAHLLICPELFDLEAIRQDLGIAAGRERMGQLAPEQQETEAQQDIALGCAANDNTPWTHHSMNATSNIQAFC